MGGSTSKTNNEKCNECRLKLKCFPNPPKNEFIATDEYCLGLIVSPNLSNFGHQMKDTVNGMTILGRALKETFLAMIDPTQDGRREQLELNKQIQGLNLIKAPIRPRRRLKLLLDVTTPPKIADFTHSDFLQARTFWTFNGLAPNIQNDLLNDSQQNWWGSSRQLLYGKIVADILEGLVQIECSRKEETEECGSCFLNRRMHPFTAILLNPTGGIVGPGSMDVEELVTTLLNVEHEPLEYHSCLHDAAGYCKTYHGYGPGYNYRSNDNFNDKDDLVVDTTSPMAYQIGGIKLWIKLWEATTEN